MSVAANIGVKCLLNEVYWHMMLRCSGDLSNCITSSKTVNVICNLGV